MSLEPQNEPFDLHFLDAMIAHHELGASMVQEALQKSQRPEIQQLAQAIRETQDKELAQMEQWRESWYPRYFTNSLWELMDLGATDDQFDLRFINAMIPHHVQAVSLAKTALEKSDRPEIQQMAQAIITTRQQEISQMQQWKQDWYGQ